MRKLKAAKFTLEEIQIIADKQFPPPWTVLESLGIVKRYVESYQKKKFCSQVEHNRGSRTANLQAKDLVVESLGGVEQSGSSLGS